MNWGIYFLMVALMSLNSRGFSEEIKIVTIDSPLQDVLKKKTEEIGEGELPLAQGRSRRNYFWP